MVEHSFLWKSLGNIEAVLLKIDSHQYDGRVQDDDKYQNDGEGPSGFDGDRDVGGTMALLTIVMVTKRETVALKTLVTLRRVI